MSTISTPNNKLWSSDEMILVKELVWNCGCGWARWCGLDTFFWERDETLLLLWVCTVRNDLVDFCKYFLCLEAARLMFWKSSFASNQCSQFSLSEFACLFLTLFLHYFGDLTHAWPKAAFYVCRFVLDSIWSHLVRFLSSSWISVLRLLLVDGSGVELILWISWSLSM
jgi:hypothetical protein